MTSPSDLPKLIKPSNSTTDANEFLAFLNLGNKRGNTGEQKGIATKEIEADKEQQQSASGFNWACRNGDFETAGGGTRPWPNQMTKTSLEKRKREDISRCPIRDAGKNETHRSTCPVKEGDSGVGVALPAKYQQGKMATGEPKSDFKWDLYSAASHMKPPSWKENSGPKTTKKQQKFMKPRAPTFSNLGFKDIHSFSPGSRGLVQFENYTSQGQKTILPVTVHVSDATKETIALLESTPPATDQQQEETAAFAVESSTGTVLDGEGPSEQARPTGPPAATGGIWGGFAGRIAQDDAIQIAKNRDDAEKFGAATYKQELSETFTPTGGRSAQKTHYPPAGGNFAVQQVKLETPTEVAHSKPEAIESAQVESCPTATPNPSSAYSLHPVAQAASEDILTQPEPAPTNYRSHSTDCLTTDHSPASSIDESPLTPAEELIIIDPEGDLRVTVGTIGKELTVLCSSPCLRRASPKWKALIQSSPTEIHLEEDAEMVLDLLRIAHAQFASLPTHTFFNELLEFARICHVYQTTELVRPWLHAWVDPWARKAMDPGYEGFIFIAWIFGYADTFETVTHHLASTATSTTVHIPEEVLNMFDLEVRTIVVDNILRIRNAAIPDIISICHDQMETLADVNSGTCHNRCYAFQECEEGLDVHSELCDLIAIGSLDRGLRAIGIWPRHSSPSTSEMTIHGLQSQLDKLTVLSYPGHVKYDKCDVNESFHAALVLKRKEVSALQVAHKEHFESFGAAAPRNDPLVWKSKGVENMGFLERDTRSNDSDSEADANFLDPEEEYDEDDDGDYEDSESDSGSEPDEEYLESGEESDYTSDVEEDEAAAEQSESWDHPV